MVCEYPLHFQDFNNEFKDNIQVNQESLIVDEVIYQEVVLPWMELLILFSDIALIKKTSKSDNSNNSKNLLDEPNVNTSDLIGTGFTKINLVEASQILTIVGNSSDILLVLQSSGITTSSTYSATVSNVTMAVADLI